MNYGGSAPPALQVPMSPTSAVFEDTGPPDVPVALILRQAQDERTNPHERINQGLSPPRMLVGVCLFLMAWLGLWTPEVRAGHGDTHTPVGTTITHKAAYTKFTWQRVDGSLFGDSRTVFADTPATATVGLLSAVDVSANLDTVFIGPRDSYTYVKHIRNIGNGFDTYIVRGDSASNFVTGIFLDVDGDSVYDASDPPAGTIILKDFTETVVLVVVKAPSTALAGAADTLSLSVTSSITLPSAETVSLVLTLDSEVPKVVLASPATNSDTSDTTPTLTWNALTDSSGIDSYALEVSSSPTFATMAFSDTVDGSRTSDTTTALVSNTYYWRVRAIDSVANMGRYSDSFVLTIDTGIAVTLVSPADATETQSATITFVWQSTSAETYTWQLSKTSAFTTIADSVVDTKTVSLVRTISHEDTYFWRVIAKDTDGNMDTTTGRSFVLDSTVSQVSAASPAAAHETTSVNVVVSWSAVADSVGVDSYVVEASKTSAFTATVFADTTDGANTADTITGLYNDTYFWRVRAVDDLGNVGANSAARGFVVDTSVAQVSAAGPSNAHETTNTRPVVSWSAVADSVGIDSYVVEASKTSAFTATVFADTTDGTNTADTITGLYNDTYFWRVRAVDDLGGVGANSTARVFIIDTAVAQVSAASPANAHETTNAPALVVSWSAVADSVGVDSYVVEASKTSAFTATVFADTTDGANTADTITGLYNDTYFWRVRAVDDLGNAGANSTARGFVVDTAVEKITLLSPSTGSATADTTPALTWTAISDSVGIDSYIIEVSSSASFATFAFADTVDSGVTSDTTTALASNTYYWRVRAIDDLGNMGANSDSFSLRIETAVAVVLVSPANGHETTNAMVTFVWSSPTAETYTWQLSKNSAFSTFVDSVVDTKSVQVQKTLPNQDTFYWRVIAKDTAGNMDTATGRIIILDTQVGQVTLVSPNTGHETSTARPVVVWSAVTDSVGIDSYVVEVSNTLSFTTTVFVDTTDGTNTADTITGLYNDTYFWRVRAIDRVGNVGANSDTRGFVLDTNVNTVTLVSPATGATTTDTRPALTWTALTDSVGIDSYAVEVSISSTFASVVFSDTVDSGVTTDTVTVTLAADTYYWRVHGIDRLGNVGPNPTAFNFRVDSGVKVSLVSPADRHETTAATFRFEWTTTDDAETYTWQISGSSAFTTISDSVVDTTATSVLKTFTREDTYFWRVIGKDRSGNQDTQSRGFVLDTHAGQVSVVSPADAHETSNTRPLVTWIALADSVGIDSYVVEASKTAAFTATVFADTLDGTNTTDTITGLYNDTYFWRVRAIDDLGNTGTVSTARGILVDTAVGQVTLVSPAADHETSNAKPVVTWTAVTVDSVGIDSYVVEASKSAAFTATVFADTTDGTNTTDTITGLYNDTYFWRVRAIDRLGNVGANSAARGILVDTEAGSVTLVSPAGGFTTKDTTPAFTWTSSSDSAGLDSHVLQVAKDAAFTNLKFVDTVDGSVTADTIGGANFLTEDTYYWRVIAIDDAGNTFASSTLLFTIDTTTPTIPSLVSPPYGHETTTTKPTFRWAVSADSGNGSNAGSGVKQYLLEVWRDSTFVSLYRTDTYTVDGGTLASALIDTISGELASDTYYWRVIAVDNAGNTTSSDLPLRQIKIVVSTASIAFDQTEYKGFKASAKITLTDPPANLSALIADVAEVTVFSDADPAGFTILLIESAINSNVFEGSISFTGGLSDAASKKLRVNPGSGITATRVQTNGITVAGSARWLTDQGLTPPTSVEKVRSWPNPANPTLGQPVIFQSLPADPSMTIEIYTLDMKKVKTLYNGNGISASAFGNSAQWDGKNDGGEYVASGVYLYIVRSSFGTTVKKITLIK